MEESVAEETATASNFRRWESLGAAVHYAATKKKPTKCWRPLIFWGA